MRPLKLPLSYRLQHIYPAMAINIVRIRLPPGELRQTLKSIEFAVSFGMSLPRAIRQAFLSYKRRKGEPHA